MAPRVGSTGEDDGYLVTLTTDMNADASYCLVFDAARVADGPVCKLQLPERISSGTHSTWVPGAELRRWDTAESAASAQSGCDGEAPWTQKQRRRTTHWPTQSGVDRRHPFCPPLVELRRDSAVLP